MTVKQDVIVLELVRACELALYGNDDAPGLNDMTSTEFQHGKDKPIRQALEHALELWNIWVRE